MISHLNGRWVWVALAATVLAALMPSVPSSVRNCQEANLARSSTVESMPAADAIAAKAAMLESWLGDVRVTPRFRTPLDKRLAAAGE